MVGVYILLLVSTWLNWHVFFRGEILSYRTACTLIQYFVPGDMATQL
jgi:hypothetical protein